MTLRNPDCGRGRRDLRTVAAVNDSAPSVVVPTGTGGISNSAEGGRAPAGTMSKDGVVVEGVAGGGNAGSGAIEARGSAFSDVRWVSVGGELAVTESDGVARCRSGAWRSGAWRS